MQRSIQMSGLMQLRMKQHQREPLMLLMILMMPHFLIVQHELLIKSSLLKLERF